MKTLSMTLLDFTLAIYRFPAQVDLPKAALESPFVSIMRTQDELSIVLPESVELACNTIDAGWACFKVNGPLALDQVGVMAKITAALAQAGVALFALSTYDTDYILVKQAQVPKTLEAFTAAGMKMTNAGNNRA